jgi:hypothetical protein
MILKHLPSYEAENDELGFDPQDFQAARDIANIYITKGERAGLQAQGDSQVSEMIDELLSDAGASGLRTIWELDEQGVAEGSSTNAEVTKRAKAAAQKAGKTFDTDVEYRLWYAITTQANAATRKADKKQGVAEGDDIGYHQTSGTKAGHTISSRKLSNKPQASKADVTLQSGSMHHSGESYDFPKGTLFTQLPGGIFAKHPSVPETHPGYGHLIRRSEDNIHAIHSALTSEQGITEGASDFVGDSIEALRSSVPGLKQQDFLDELYMYIENQYGQRAAEMMSNAGQDDYDEWYDSYLDNSDQGITEGGFKNLYAEFSGYGNYMQGRAVNVFTKAGLEIVSKEYSEDDDIQTYVVKGDRQSIEKAGEFLERNPEQFGGYHFVKQGVSENYPKHQDLSGISTDKLKAYLARQSQQSVPGEGSQVRRVQAELQRRTQGVAEAKKNSSNDDHDRLAIGTNESRLAKRALMHKILKG